MVDEFESIQLALFTSAPPSLDALKLWDAIFGSSPGGFQTHNPGHTQAQGRVGDLEVVVMAQVNRFDIVMQAPVGPPPAMPPAPIPDIQKALDDGISYAEKALPYLNVGRVAAVIQGNCFASSPQDAVAKFISLYPDCKVPAGATAVTYEFTAPKKSGLNQNRNLMRLCRWQTVHSQYFNLAPGTTQVAQRFAVHSYVDVFSEAMEALSAQDALAGLKEVADEANKIIAGGPNAVS